MKVIVALGNPGEQYELTRHNVGFIFADYLFKKLSLTAKYQKRFDAVIADTIINNEKVLIVKPQTYMNLSGISLRSLMDYYKFLASDVIVVQDDCALPVGRIRIKGNGTSGGHNGIKSIIKTLDTMDFVRIKIGIDHSPDYFDSAGYVLEKFPEEELKIIYKSVKMSYEALMIFFEHGLLRAQQQFNGKNVKV